jgi:hypothetical protein
MSEDLFPIEPSAPTPLQKARARLADAEAEFDRLRKFYGPHGPEPRPELMKAEHELLSAANSVQVEENKALEKLKQ